MQCSVLVVTFETKEVAEAYVAETRIPWPLLIDSTRAVYEAYGMGQGHWWSIWGPPSWRAYAGLIRKGRRVRSPTGDIYQLGGDVLIDPAGRVVLHHVGDGPADRRQLSRVGLFLSATG